MRPPPGPGARIAPLDGLRGFAVLWVVLFHATGSMGHSHPLVRGALSVLHVGWFGVDIFFALSGFLITRILLADKHKPPGDFFGGFYWRRTLRVLPIYFLVLGLLVVVPSVVDTLQTRGWRRFIDEQAWFWLYAANIRREYAGAATPALEYDWFELTHTWSLSVEEHFYLIWPLLVYVLPPLGLWAALAGLLGLSITLHDLPLSPTTAAVLATPKQAAWLCVGASLALWSHEWPVQAARCAERLRPVARVFEARWLVFLGTYSYGLYMYHYVFAPLWRRTDLRQWPGGYTVGMLCCTVLYVGLPLLVAIASFRWIESPLLRLKGSRKTRQT